MILEERGKGKRRRCVGEGGFVSSVGVDVKIIEIINTAYHLRTVCKFFLLSLFFHLSSSTLNTSIRVHAV